MAVFDTHKAYEALTAGGFTDSQAKTLLDTLGDSNEALATKTDIGTVKTDLRELELRMRLNLYGVAIVVIGVLAALELLPR
ncbi:MAG: DUF1640 domain-containing protein [Chloroflexi bacterium]|nr:DUF1640 domain-containing protein [Chloroflexota bacterium]